MIMLDEAKHQQTITYTCKNGAPLRDAILTMYSVLRVIADVDKEGCLTVTCSLTEEFAKHGFSESDRVLVTWFMYHFKLLQKLKKKGFRFTYKLADTHAGSLLSAMAMHEAADTYRNEKYESKRRRKAEKDSLLTVAETTAPPATPSAPAPVDGPLSPALAEKIASLLIALEEKDAALAVAHKRIADLEDLVLTLKAASVPSVEDQLVAAIEKLRSKT